MLEKSFSIAMADCLPTMFYKKMGISFEVDTDKKFVPPRSYNRKKTHNSGDCSVNFFTDVVYQWVK